MNDQEPSPFEEIAKRLEDGAARGARYLAGVAARPVFPPAEALQRLEELGGPLPPAPTDPAEVVALLDEIGSPATVGTVGPRYFGFVIGGVLPACAGASALATAWDECAGLRNASPLGAHLEDVARGWLLDALHFEPDVTVGFATGATMANLSGLAAARHALLAGHGWNVEKQGLFGAPPFRVIVGDEVHASVLKALALLGLGTERVERVPTDEQGRLRAELLPNVDEPALFCVQAGNVNTGSFDPIGDVVAHARASGSWVHVDGAFGLWACTSRERAHLTAGIRDADSWSVDAHKWLNVPYDSGLVLVRDGEALRSAMRSTAPYLLQTQRPDPTDHTPEMSRRARGIEVWAALRSLGRSGIEDLVERCCRHARRLAEALDTAGHEILNDVVLNQVLVAFGDDARTDRTIAGLQESGVAWAGGTTWHGRRALRLAPSNWTTTDEDVDRTVEAILAAAGD